MWRILKNSMPFRCFALIGLATLLLLSGCGGGSSGTGGDGTQVLGKLVDTNGEPIPAATITLAETGDSGVTDNDGSFQFESVVTVSNLTFLVAKNQIEAHTSLNEVPPQPLRINVVLRLDAGAKQLMLESSEIQKRSEQPAVATPSADDSKIDIQFYVKYPQGFLDGSTLAVDGAGMPREAFKFQGSQQWFARVKLAHGAPTGAFILRSPMLGRYGINLQGIAPGSTRIRIYTQFSPLPSNGVVPTRIELEPIRTVVSPSGLTLPSVSISQLERPDPSAPGANPTPRVSPTPYPGYPVNFFVSYDYPGTILENATVSVPELDLGGLRLQRYHLFSETNPSWTLEFLANRTVSEITIILHTAKGDFTSTISGFDKSIIGYLSCTARLVPIPTVENPDPSPLFIQGSGVGWDGNGPSPHASFVPAPPK